MKIPKGCIPVRFVRPPLPQYPIIRRGGASPLAEVSAMGMKDWGPNALEVFKKDPATGNHLMTWQDPKYRAFKKKKGIETAEDFAFDKRMKAQPN